MLLAGDIRGSAVKYVVGMTTLVIVYIALTDTTIPPAVDLYSRVSSTACSLYTYLQISLSIRVCRHIIIIALIVHIICELLFIYEKRTNR